MTDENESEEVSSPALGEEVRSPDAAVRWRVAAVLADMPGEESEELLLGLLGDDDYRVRERSIASLTRRFTPRVAAVCASALADDENAGRRGAALTVLTRTGENGRMVLLNALGHAQPDVRIAAAMSLPGARADTATVAALEAATRTETDPNVKAALLLALGRTGRREAVAPLLAVLEEGTLWLRVHALEALAEIGEPDVASRLLPLLQHPGLRKATLRALAQLPSSAPAEELARRAAEGERDDGLLAALRRSLSAGTPEARRAVGELWPDAGKALREIAENLDGSIDERTEAAHLLAILDLPGAASSIVRCGPFKDAFEALTSLAPSRFREAIQAALQAEDPEPALAVVVLARLRHDTAGLRPLLVHPSPVVRSAVLAALPPGAASVAELIDILAEEDPETALPAAYALAAGDAASEEGRSRRGALLDRAKGPDGAGRVAALLALAELDVPGIDSAVHLALGSNDPEVRRAAATAAGSRRSFPEGEVTARLTDPDAGVRAAILRTLARWASAVGVNLATSWRDLLPFLADEPAVAAAAGAAIIALAGPDRSRLVGEFLAQSDAIRRAALEEIPATSDPAAADAASVAAMHEDTETARAALYAMALAQPSIADEALAEALSDERPEVRQAAAEVIVRRPPPDGPGVLSDRLAEALVKERDPQVLHHLLPAAARAGAENVLEPLTTVLAAERPGALGAAADQAATQLARRFPEAVKRIWMTSPARAERRWARAMSRVKKDA